MFLNEIEDGTYWKLIMVYFFFLYANIVFLFLGIDDLKSKKVATDELDSYEALVRDAGY